MENNLLHLTEEEYKAPGDKVKTICGETVEIENICEINGSKFFILESINQLKVFQVILKENSSEGNHDA